MDGNGGTGSALEDGRAMDLTAVARGRFVGSDSRLPVVLSSSFSLFVETRGDVAGCLGLGRVSGVCIRCRTGSDCASRRSSGSGEYEGDLRRLRPLLLLRLPDEGESESELDSED